MLSVEVFQFGELCDVSLEIVFFLQNVTWVSWEWSIFHGVFEWQYYFEGMLEIPKHSCQEVLAAPPKVNLCIDLVVY